VQGIWWTTNRPIKRQVDVGLGDGSVRPWLVPGLPFVEDCLEPREFPLPWLARYNGRDLGSFYSVVIDPRIPEAAKMRRNLPGRPERFAPERDLPVLLRVARDQMRRRIGPDVDRPWESDAGGG
jgi:hypothetical protein